MRAAAGRGPLRPGRGPDLDQAVARELAERGDELGVELAARAALELRERPVEPERRPVAVVRGHAVDRVAHRDDPRLARDRGAFEAVRIAAAVEPLVVVVDD